MTVNKNVVWILYLTSCLVFGVVGTSEPVLAETIPQSLVGIELYDPLQDSHLVVRGTVVQVSTGTARVDYGTGTGDVTVTRVSVRVSEVLKGMWNQPEIVLEAEGGVAQFFLGNQEFVICAKWFTRQSGGAFVIGSHLGIYERRDDTWVKVIWRGSEKAESLSLVEIRERVGRATLASVVDSSDVVVRGIIEAKWESSYSAGVDKVGRMTNYRLNIHEVLKGDSLGSSVAFVVPIMNVSYVPRWFRLTPGGIEKGQEWLVFLRRGERGYYPFAGPNSLLMVSGKDLIYDAAVKYPIAADVAEQQVRAEVSSERE